MDSFEINKIIAAVLLTALIIIGIGKFTDILFHVEKPKESAYKIEGLEVAATNASACLLYTSPSPRDSMTSRMPSSA